MLVEFIGAAGTGKSFLSERVAIHLHGKGLATEDFNLLPIKKFAPGNLFLALRSVHLSTMTKPRNPLMLVRAAGMIARYSIRRRICHRRDGIFITGEGMFHRMITLHRNSRSLELHELANVLFRRIQPPDLLVAIEAEPGIVFERRFKRNRENDIFTAGSVRADIESVRKCVEIAEDVKRALRPSMEILRVTVNDEGGKVAVDAIVSSLERLDYTVKHRSSSEPRN